MNKEENIKIKITDEMLAVPGVHIIDAPTGAGKSHAIGKLTGKVLVVSPRCVLVDQQTENEFKEHKNITVRTIQSLAYMPNPVEYIIGNSLDFYGRKWDAVIVDEAHDLLVSSDYDDKCIELVKIILRAPVLICLTATNIGLEKLFRFLGRNAIIHKYADNIRKKLCGGTFGYVPDIETAVDVINRKLKKGEKVLFFADKISQITKIMRAFLGSKEILPVVAKSNSAYKKLCKERVDEINMLVTNQKFPEGVSVVCATKVMDVGLNIRDDKVTTVICSMACLATLRQCMGRKRLDNTKNEKVDFYCIPPTGQSLAKRKEKIEVELGKYDTYKNYYDIHLQEREGVKLDNQDIVYYTYRDGKLVEEIDYCKLVYYEYLLETVYKTPTVLEWKRLVEQMLGCQGVPMKAVKQQKTEQWQYEQTMKFLNKLENGLIETKVQKEAFEYIYGDEFKGPKAFNRLWEERGWNFHMDGSQEGKATYVTDENGKKKRKRNRDAWRVTRDMQKE